MRNLPGIMKLRL